MPFELPLPANLHKARWRVKIREKETREPPHVTILRRTRAWRINLRTREYMDADPDPGEVAAALDAFVREEGNWQTLCRAWDEKYPDNPVGADVTPDGGSEHADQE